MLKHAKTMLNNQKLGGFQWFFNWRLIIGSITLLGLSPWDG